MTKAVKAGAQDGHLTARTIREADEAAAAELLADAEEEGSDDEERGRPAGCPRGRRG